MHQWILALSGPPPIRFLAASWLRIPKIWEISEGQKHPCFDMVVDQFLERLPGLLAEHFQDGEMVCSLASPTLHFLLEIARMFFEILSPSITGWWLIY